MKIYTFEIIEDESVLVYEQTLDQDGNIIYTKDVHSDPLTENHFKYDGPLLLEEIEMGDGMELSKNEFIYNEKGESIESRLYVSGELFQKVTTEYSDSGMVRTTFLEGEEIEKLVRETDGENYKNRFYERGILVEIHTSEYSQVTNATRTKVYDSENRLISDTLEKYNDLDLLISLEEYNENNQLIRESKYDIDGALVKSEIHRDFTNATNEYKVLYEYDENQNMVKKEVLDLSGKLIEFNIKKYDDRNRLIEEQSVSNGSFDAIYGTSVNGEAFHLIHKYED